jgi:hypothetical protein
MIHHAGKLTPREAAHAQTHADMTNMLVIRAHKFTV